VAELRVADPSPTERLSALAAQLLERHGVFTRDALAAEDVPGGFATVYPVLKAMEESGRARRGYFVNGLGGAQFAPPGAVDRLRALRGAHAEKAAAAVVLAAADPANPYGAALRWPEPRGEHGHLPRRAPGARVVLVDGALGVYLEKGGRSLLTFSDDEQVLSAAARALGEAVDRGQVERLQVQRIDGDALGRQPLVAHLRAAGFADHPRGLIRR
jgi:ATP-dependent Lhr-like helicase